MWTSPESREFLPSPMFVVERVFAIVNDYEENRTEAYEVSQEYKSVLLGSKLAIFSTQCDYILLIGRTFWART